MQDKVEQIIKSRGYILSKGYHYSLLYQIKPDIDGIIDDPVLGLLVNEGMITPQTKTYQRGACESDFDVIRIYPLGQNSFELTREEWDNFI